MILKQTSCFRTLGIAGVSGLNMETMMAIAAPEALGQVHALYVAGKYLRALDASRDLGPLKTWPGTIGRLLAARLSSRLGGQKLSRQLMAVAYREFPRDWSVRYYHAYHLLWRRGPLRAVERLLDCGDFTGANLEQQAEWLALTGTVHAMLRDFDAAQEYLQRALELQVDRPWIWTEQGFVLTAMDKRREAIAAYDQALALRPWFRPAVEAKSDLLADLGDDQATLEFLRGAVEHLEDGRIVVSLAALLREMGGYEESRELYERARLYYPLADEPLLEWLDASCADAAYYCGDYEAARALAAKVDTPFFQKWGEQLARAATDDRRVLLPVQFVRQHHMTCAPATLAALSAYWGQPADHLELAEKICYDGTPGHSERRWTEARWPRVREFAVDWDTARALIDRGIPFTLETQAATSGHLQAVVGYDSRRGTLLIRDPGQRHTREFIAETLFQDLASSGPRGMAFVPDSHVQALEEVSLPDADLYDRYFELQCALADHRRDAANAVAEEIHRQYPGARLALVASRCLCYYDGDHAGALAITEQLLERYPGDSRLEVERLNCLARLRRIADRMKRLAALCAEDEGRPVYWRFYGQELAEDARRHPEAVYWLERAASTLGPDGPTYSALANIHWEQGCRERALRLYRFAACIEDKWESYAKSYFIAARHLKCEQQVLKWLARRFEQYGHKSSGPAITLHDSLRDLDRYAEAERVLESALLKRPDDGELLTFAAEQLGWANRYDEAQAMLARAESSSHRGAWLRAAARVAEARGDVQESLRAWRSLAELEPLNVDAHRAIYDQLRATEGEAAALDYIRAVGAAHPHHVAIQELLLLKLRGADPAEATAVARRSLALHPNDGWTRRELSLLLAMQGQVDEALAESDAAVHAEPSVAASFTCRAQLYANLGKRDRAREDYRRALKLSVDWEPAIDGLLEVCEGDEERREAVRYIAEECRRQTTFGEGLWLLIDRAHELVPADELLKFARDAHAARPDLWQTWCALSKQLGRCRQLEESLRIAIEATQRFPLLPRTWLELAHVHRDAERTNEQIAAYQQALEVSPSWGRPAQELSDALLARGDGEQAREVLEHVARRAPLDLATQGYLADLLWQQNRREEAMRILARVCRLSSTYEWAWNTLRGWLLESGRGGELLEIARSQTELRPGNPDAWLRLADALGAVGGGVEDRLNALEKAIGIEPGNIEAHASRVELLVEQERFDEALAAARSPAWGDHPPVRLRAWEADVRARQGKVDEAIDEFQKILEQFPRYSWVCYRLNVYLWQSKRWQEGCRAAERFTELDPNAAMSWGYLGGFLQQTGENARAKEAFQRSCQAEPDYEFGARRLAEMLLDESDADGAAAVMDEWSKHGQDNPYSLAVKLRIAIARSGRKADLQALEALAALKCDDYDGYQEFGALLRDSVVRGRAMPVLRKLLRDEATNAQLGATWAAIDGATWKSLGALYRARSSTPAWRCAASQFATLCGNAENGWLAYVLTKLLGGHLRDDADCWGLAGYALVNSDFNAAAHYWLRDWRFREDVQPWMLCNVSFAEWSLGRFEHVRDASQVALSLAPDNTRGRHRTLLAAAQLALGAEATDIVQGLADMDGAQPDGPYLAIHELTLAAAKAIAEPSRDYLTAFRQLQGVLYKHRSRLKRYAGGNKLGNAAMERVAAAHGHRLRALWYRLRKTLHLPC